MPLLEDRFGSISAEARDYLEKLSMDELRSLVLKIAGASSLGELGLPE